MGGWGGRLRQARRWQRGRTGLSPGEGRDGTGTGTGTGGRFQGRLPPPRPGGSRRAAGPEVRSHTGQEREPGQRTRSPNPAVTHRPPALPPSGRLTPHRIASRPIIPSQPVPGGFRPG